MTTGSRRQISLPVQHTESVLWVRPVFLIGVPCVVWFWVCSCISAHREQTSRHSSLYYCQHHHETYGHCDCL